jgi:pimeloyl-ACP methyl ester carboxylesterase
MADSKTVTANGLDLKCYFDGLGNEGAAVVLLHGAGADSAMLSWKEVVPLLAGKGFRVIAPDLPGYGGSARFSGDYSLGFYAETIKALIGALGLGPVVLCGLSLGGGIALTAALEFPELLKAIISVDAWGLFEKLPNHRLTHWFVNSRINKGLYRWTGKSKGIIRWSLEANLISDKSKVTDALVGEVLTAMRQPDAGEPFRSFQMCEITRDGLATPIFGRLGEIALPTLLVHGSRDKAVPLCGAVAAQKLMPNARLHIMEGCKHWPQKERPEEFVAAAAGFLGELD